MESSNQYLIDIQVVQSKFSQKLRLINSKPETPEVVIDEIRMYQTEKFNESEVLKQKPANLKFTQVKISNDCQQNSYLNLSQGEKINKIELINKYVIETSQQFKSPEDIVFLYYFINEQTDSIHYFIFDKSENSVILPKNIKVSFVQFMQDLTSLNAKHQCVLAIGFLMSVGCLLESLQTSLEQIPLYRMFNKSVDFFTPVLKFGVQQFQSANGILIEGIQTQEYNLNRVYFIDSCQFIFELMNAQQKQQIETPSLLQYLRILNKEQYKSEKGGEDRQSSQVQNLNNYMSNLWSFADTIYEQRLFDRKLKLMDLLNLPISYVLYQTPVTCLQQYILRQFFQNNWMFMYKQSFDNQAELTNDFDQNGGIFEIVNPDLKFKALKFVFEGDYFSLYPTIILAYNISIETMVPESQISNYSPSQLWKLVLNYRTGITKQEEKYIYFLKAEVRKGIFPSLVEVLLEQRKLAPKGSSVYQSLKVLLASIYGIVGMRRFSLFNSQCQKVICSMGRFACDVAQRTIESDILFNQPSVTARYTDSCQFMLPSDKMFHVSFKKLQKQWHLVQQKIQTEMQSNLFNFQLESQFSVVKVYLSQINSQISLTAERNEDYKQVKKQIDNTESLKLIYKQECNNFKFKGLINWNKYKLDIRTQLKEILILIIVELRSQESPNVTQVVNNILRIYIQQVDKDIQSIKNKGKSWEDRLKLLTKYATHLKYSQKENTCKYLINIYKIKDAVWIVPYSSSDLISSKRLSEGFIPLDFINSENVLNVNFECLKNVFNPIKMLFGIKTELFSSSGNLASTLVKSIKPDVFSCQLRIETSAGSYKKCSFGIFNIDDVYQLVINNKKQSFHEVLVNSINKMYFDIDSKDKILESDICLNIMKLVRLLSHKVYEIKIFIASAFKYDENGEIVKYSFHCVTNIACTKSMNAFLAEQLNKSLNKSVDLGVYNANSSLRLPLTPKIEKNGTVEERLFKFDKMFAFKDFVITDISTCIQKIQDSVLFDTKPPITISVKLGEVNSELVAFSLEQLKKITSKTSWSIRNNADQKYIFTFVCQQPYKCPVCLKKHDSDNLFGVVRKNCMKINCYSNKTRNNNLSKLLEIQLPNQEEPANLDESVLSDESVVLDTKGNNQKYQFAKFKESVENIQRDDYSSIAVNLQSEQFVQFDLMTSTTYVISGMGSGKSTQLVKLLESNQFETIICLSFRITFTSEFSKKYKLTSYKDIHGQIQLKYDPKVIIQVDSLFRLNESQCPDLLIIDEIESILEKIQSSGQKLGVMYSFIKLIQFSKKVVIMDGLMEKMTIKYLNLLRETDNYQVIFNTMLTRSDYSLQLYQYHSTQFEFILQIFEKFISEGKNIYGMVTQKKLGDFITDTLKAKNIKAIYYHGDNLRDETNMQKHSDVKEEHFKNVNEHWVKYQVVLHSSTVTAGVSFDIPDHFDVQINVLNENTCSAVSFIQGCHRVRHLKDKQVISFIEPRNQHGEYIPANLTKKEFQFHDKYNNMQIDISENKSLYNWLAIREQMSADKILDLVIKYSKSMGYQITPMQIPEDFKGSVFKIDKLIAKKIAEVQLPPSFDLIYQMDSSLQQLAQQKFELARLYYMFDCINSLTDIQVKYLIKYKYIQDYRIKIKNECPLMESDDSKQMQRFWIFTSDWLNQLQYKPTSFHGVDPMISHTLLKAQGILKETQTSEVSLQKFEELCKAAEFDTNQLTNIQRLKVPLRFKKNLNVSKLVRNIIALMFVLCYESKVEANQVTFTRFSVPNAIGLISEAEESKDQE